MQVHLYCLHRRRTEQVAVFPGYMPFFSDCFLATSWRWARLDTGQHFPRTQLAHLKHPSTAWAFHITARGQPDATASVKQAESNFLYQRFIYCAQGIILIQLPDLGLTDFGGPRNLFHRAIFELDLILCQLSGPVLSVSR